MVAFALPPSKRLFLFPIPANAGAAFLLATARHQFSFISSWALCAKRRLPNTAAVTIIFFITNPSFKMSYYRIYLLA